jgi:hypothetical protein
VSALFAIFLALGSAGFFSLITSLIGLRNQKRKDDKQLEHDEDRLDLDDRRLDLDALVAANAALVAANERLESEIGRANAAAARAEEAATAARKYADDARREYASRLDGLEEQVRQLQQSEKHCQERLDVAHRRIAELEELNR